jgi:hypothetical protein
MMSFSDARCKDGDDARARAAGVNLNPSTAGRLRKAGSRIKQLRLARLIPIAEFRATFA